MTIFGDKDATKQFQAVNTELDGPAEFETGTTNEFEMELDDVGTVSLIFEEYFVEIKNNFLD